MRSAWLGLPLLAGALACQGANRGNDPSDPSTIAQSEQRQRESAIAIRNATERLRRAIATDEAELQRGGAELARRDATAEAADTTRDSLRIYHARVDSLRRLNRQRQSTIALLTLRLDSLQQVAQGSWVQELAVMRSDIADLTTRLRERDERIAQLEYTVDSLVEINQILRDSLAWFHAVVNGADSTNTTAAGEASEPSQRPEPPPPATGARSSVDRQARYVVMAERDARRLDLLGYDDFLRCDRMPTGSTTIDIDDVRRIRVPRGRSLPWLIGRPDLREMLDDGERAFWFDGRDWAVVIQDPDRFWKASRCLVILTR